MNQQTVELSKDHWALTKPIAHRGLHDESSPENSLAAFQAAIDHGFPIELDIHLLADGKIVVFHDDDLKRMVGDLRQINKVTSLEIKDLKLINSDQGIPLLSEVLDLVKGQVPLVIEIKNTHILGELEDELFHLLKNYSGEVAIQAFNHLSLIKMKQLMPEIPRGMLSAGDLGEISLFKKWLVQNYILFPLVKPSYVAHDFNSLDDMAIDFLNECCKVPLLSWTIRNEEEYQKVKNRVGNVIFENIFP